MKFVTDMNAVKPIHCLLVDLKKKFERILTLKHGGVATLHTRIIDNCQTKYAYSKIQLEKKR